jgi:hypothetical protein
MEELKIKIRADTENIKIEVAQNRQNAAKGTE